MIRLTEHKFNDQINTKAWKTWVKVVALFP